MWMDGKDYVYVHQIPAYSYGVKRIEAYDLNDRRLYVVVEYESGLLTLLEYGWSYLLNQLPRRGNIFKSLARIVAKDLEL